MAAPQPTFAMCSVWLTILMIGGLVACAAPPPDESPKKLAVLDRLVGSWAYGQDGVSARQECKWILNKQFLEIDTNVSAPGQPPSSWRTLIAYDKTSNCYRLWRFSETGVVSTAQGAWDENTSSLALSGRTLDGNDSESRFEIIDDKTMIVSVREFLDEKHSKLAVVRSVLCRVPPPKDQQPTK